MKRIIPINVLKRGKFRDSKIESLPLSCHNDDAAALVYESCKLVLNAYKEPKGARFKHIFLNIILYRYNYLFVHFPYNHLVQPYLYFFIDDNNPKILPSF